MTTAILAMADFFTLLLGETESPAPLSVYGWITMVIAVGGVALFLGWCIYKIVMTPGSTGHLHTQVDITPADFQED